MRIEVTIAKTSPLPAGAIDALAGELSRRIQYAFPDNEGHVSVRYAAANNLSVIGATKEDKQRISEILQETWESADGLVCQRIICSDFCFCRVAPAFLFYLQILSTKFLHFLKIIAQYAKKI
ncbi:damage-inducible protein [Escherichia coli]|nr:damage-inducible protein [Escherichia coli]